MRPTIIIPTLNSEPTIGATLKSLKIAINNCKYSVDIEIIVVDGGSKDNTVEIINSFDDIKVFHCSKKGAAAARNIGIAHAKGDIICFTDSDCIVSKNWLNVILHSFETNPSMDGMGGPLLPYKPRNKIELYNGRIFQEMMRYSKEFIEVQFPSFVGSLITANCAYRANVLRDLGGFDESFFTSGEDIDLWWRASKSGKKLFFNPNMIVYHVFPNTIRGLFKQYYKYGIGSSKLRKKHFNNKIFIDWYLYKLLLISFLNMFSLQNEKREFNLIRSFQILSHVFGRFVGSIYSRVINL